ncbi:hypothetical protein BKA61DRAFT_710126 [Leptodontidium sp. MPI-SDFR-AT-0119]|nr:hypothetical protein BKA61DRAFT_710126 [Leptodontidium sp. MPI-SDFR-AT-0119]
MCNQILFTFGLCTHTSALHPSKIPPVFESLCPLALRSTCLNLHTTNEHRPNSLCPPCDPTHALPYSWYKHELYPPLCGHAFGHADSDLIRFLDEDDVVLVAPTEMETCGARACKGLDVRDDPFKIVSRSVMPSQYENPTRVFTTEPKREVRYLDKDMKPKAEIVWDLERGGESDVDRDLSTLKAQSEVKASKGFHDISTSSSDAFARDEEALNFPTAHFSSEASTPLTAEEEEEIIMNFPSKWADPKYFPPTPERGGYSSGPGSKRISGETGSTTQMPTSSRYSTARSQAPEVSSSNVSSYPPSHSTLQHHPTKGSSRAYQTSRQPSRDSVFDSWAASDQNSTAAQLAMTSKNEKAASYLVSGSERRRTGEATKKIHDQESERGN